MNISIPKLSLVVLVGPSGSGKSSFARKHFLPTEILSSDVCRGLVSDDENSQSATNDAFDVLNFIAEKRLAAGKLTVIDATNVQSRSRGPLVALAKKFHMLPVVIVLNLPEKVCIARNSERSDRNFGPHVIRQQRSQLRQSLRKLRSEGFRHVYVLDSEEAVASAVIERVPLWNDRSDLHGPFDFIGDVHGCCDELELLLQKLGYEKTTATVEPGWSSLNYAHPEKRTAVFVGDLVDRGPRVVDSLSLVRNMMHSGAAMCVPGNHEEKLLRWLRGKEVVVKHGLAQTISEIEAVPGEQLPSFKKQLADFIDGLISHFVLDRGRIVVAHAGMPQRMQGRGSATVRSFALYGETTGETDEYGLPVRHNWAADYRGDAMVVYGHTPVPVAEWLNRTIDIDTGCVFGGSLTALRYPEQDLVSVPALAVHCVPVKPLNANQPDGKLTGQQLNDDLLDAEDVIGKRIVSTRLRNNITIQEENATAALEVMSRFAANPKWLIYLPPTMSPSESSSLDQFLEHPREAFSYFRSQKIETVVCEEKHMGSRAVVIVCRNPEIAIKRFGIAEREIGIVTTRTGRHFFSDRELENEFLQKLVSVLDTAEFWSRHQTDWVCLDCELMPWSAKAQDLLQQQYAAVGAAARQSLPAVLSSLETAIERYRSSEKLNESVQAAQKMLERFQSTAHNVDRFTNAYRQYCWPVNSLDDYRLAPFHILATEGSIHSNQNHHWHLAEIEKMCAADTSTKPLLQPTKHLTIELASDANIQSGIDWWLELTSRGGEGMVVKPLEFIAYGKKGLVQPAIKCRGPEYLRIIYGPDYDQPENLKRLRNRSLGRKRSLALREFALGIESLERFIARQPLRKVHECVFGVLALESEPVDPRL